MKSNKRTFGIIGNPIDHSFSPQYFTEKFKKEEIFDAEYLRFPLSDISSIREWIFSMPTLQGFNVTHPYKQAILPKIDIISPAAAEIGAVNCIRIERNNNTTTLYGYNTDHIGFTQTLKTLKITQSIQALILGSGGAAQAIIYSLKQQNIKHKIVSRNPDKGDFTYNEITSETLKNYPLIIQTTPLGMEPYTNSFPKIPYEYINHKNILIDLIYNPTQTIFLQKGAKNGAKICNGMPMLISQAEANWKIWNNQNLF